MIIIGYSFPPTDTRALDLLRGALASKPGQLEVELVAPDASSIVERTDKGLLGLAKKFTAHDITFDQYLEQFSERIPEMLKQVALSDPSVQRWIELMRSLAFATDEQRAALHRSHDSMEDASE